jgi:hypothetical protein
VRQQLWADRRCDRVNLVAGELEPGRCDVLVEVRGCRRAGDGQCDGRRTSMSPPTAKVVLVRLIARVYVMWDGGC